MLSEYSQERFAALPTFHAAWNRYPDVADTVWALGSSILDYGMEETVGVTLLHKHFDIRKGEQVVREYSHGAATIEPQPISREVVGCIWALDEVGTYRPVEFCDGPGSLGAIPQLDILKNKREFLQKFADQLIVSDVINMFGLATLGGVQYINPREGESIVEKNIGERKLRLERISTEALSRMESATTLWRFSRAPEAGAINCPSASSPDVNGKVWAHCYHCPNPKTHM
jgi:hypothetical protein